MERKDVLRLACLLPFVSGLINSMGLSLFSVVVTNVAGHFGTFSQRIFAGDYPFGFALLGGVLVYAFGAFAATWIAETQQKKGLLLLPIWGSALVLAWVHIFGVRGEEFVAMWLLFGSMGAYNAFASNLTNGQIKPSQLTGLIIDFCTDAAKIYAKKQDVLENDKLRQKNQVRGLIILSFLVGISVNIIAFQFFHLPLTFLPLLFLVATTMALRPTVR